jgi:hypothetical protein
MDSFLFWTTRLPGAGSLVGIVPANYLRLIITTAVIMSVYETCTEKIGALSNESLPLLLQCLSDTQEEVREKWHVMSFHYKNINRSLSTAFPLITTQQARADVTSLASGVDTFYLIFAVS